MGHGGVRRARTAPHLPLVVAAAASGSTIVAVVARSHRSSSLTTPASTWRDSGRGLPAGRAVALAPGDPDVIGRPALNREAAGSTPAGGIDERLLPVGELGHPAGFGDRRPLVRLQPGRLAR